MSFFRTIDLAFLIFIIIIMGFTYKIKYNAQMLIKEEKTICQQIAAEENAINKLNTDWEYLTSPAHIAKLNKKYNNDLSLKFPDPNNIITIESLKNGKLQNILTGSVLRKL